MSETKICCECGMEKPVTEFKKNSRSQGYASYCKDCGLKKRRNKFSVSEGGGLAAFTPRELIEELKRRGYRGTLKIEREVIL